MKNFQNYTPQKYETADFQKVEENIYKTKSPYGKDMIFVTSLSFEQEPDQFGEEDGCPSYISQVPFEDLLDLFGLFVTDFYEDLNAASEKTCYQEFGAFDLENIQNLRTVIGKRFYAVHYIDESTNSECYKTVLE